MTLRLLLLGIMLFLSALCAKAWQLEIYDDQTLEPVAFAYVTTADSSYGIEADANGRVPLEQLNNWPRNIDVVVQHPNYQTQQLSWPQLQNSNYVVYLTARNTIIPEIIVSANKWEQERKEVPQRIMALGAKALAFENPASMADALEATGQVFVQKSQQGGGSPMIRGFAANRLLLVVDGVRLNNAIFRSGNLQNVILLDPVNLDGLEVIYGPSSTIYGSDALGGVLDFHTLRPQFASEKGQDVLRGQLMARTASASGERTGHLDIRWGNTQWASVTSLTYNSFDDLISGTSGPFDQPGFGRRFFYVETVTQPDGTFQDRIALNNEFDKQLFSGYNQWNLLQKVAFQKEGKYQLTYAFQLSNSTDIPRYDRLTQLLNDSTFRFAEWNYGPQRWLMHQLTAKLVSPTSWFDNAQVIAAYQDYTESRVDRRFANPVRRTRTENVDALSLSADFEKAFTTKTNLLYGFEGVFNNVSSNARTENINTGIEQAAASRYPNAGSQYFTTGLYAEAFYAPQPSLNINTGLRYTYSGVTADFSDTRFFTFPFNEARLRNGALNYVLGVTWTPFKALQLNALTSSGFRAPNVDDVAKVFESGQGQIVVPNPALKPEYSYNAEVGFISRFKEVGLVLNGTAFYSHLQNAMVRRPFAFNGQDSVFFDDQLSQVQALVNTGRARVYGASLVLEWQLDPNWYINGSYTYVQGSDLEANVRLRHVPPPFGQARLGYQKEQIRLEFVVNAQGGIAFEDLPPTEQEKAYLYPAEGALSWYTIGARFGWQFKPWLNFQFKIDNALDVHYRTYSSGISAPGRQLTFTARVRW